MSKPPFLTPARPNLDGYFWAIHPSEQANFEADMALRFIERWAMVAATPDGEDDAGRQKLRRLTPRELVDHACATAKMLYEEFESRGWLIEIPPLDEAERQWHERVERERANERKPR